MLYHSILSLDFVNPSEFVIDADFSSIAYRETKKIRSDLGNRFATSFWVAEQKG